MKGLEISEVNFIELYSGIRIDAETYRPFYMEIEEKVLKGDYTTLGEISSVFKKGIFDIKASTYSNEGIPFARISNLKKMGVSTDDIIFIPESENLLNLNTYLTKGDVILSKTANPAASIVQLSNCNTSQDTVAVKLKKTSKIDSGYLVPFLNSKYGFFQMQRWFTGNIQMHLNLTDGKGIFIPCLTEDFQKLISKVFWKSFDLLETSNNAYKYAETLLLETFGLKDFEPSKEPVNIKTFSESFGSSGRLDAEYYQPKYDDIEAKILGTKHQKLCDYFNLLSNPSPKNYVDTGIKVIKTKNIRIPSVEIENITDHTNEKSLKVKKDDLLFASMGVGSLGRLSYIDSEIENCTIDGTIKLFRTTELWKNKNIEIPTLLYLTSSIGQEIIYKYVIGSTGIISISKENIENLPIPIFEKSDCTRLTKMVVDSINLKSKSEKLLELAKTAIEKAIEENEKVASILIEKELKSLNIK